MAIGCLREHKRSTLAQETNALPASNLPDPAHRHASTLGRSAKGVELGRRQREEDLVIVPPCQDSLDQTSVGGRGGASRLKNGNGRSVHVRRKARGAEEFAQTPAHTTRDAHCPGPKPTKRIRQCIARLRQKITLSQMLLRRAG